MTVASIARYATKRTLDNTSQSSYPSKVNNLVLFNISLIVDQMIFMYSNETQEYKLFYLFVPCSIVLYELWMIFLLLDIVEFTSREAQTQQHDSNDQDRPTIPNIRRRHGNINGARNDEPPM